MRIFWVLLACAGPVAADPVDQVVATAKAGFDQMPALERVDVIEGHCGADASVNDQVAYCTTRNIVFVTHTAAKLPEAPYLVAHLYGHAVQVRHGVADFALAQITARRSEEQMLRGLVERQVDCIAGFLVAQAGLPEMQLGDLMTGDPFEDRHWGRDPLRVGPQISVDLAARAEWFALGQSGDLSVCAPGEFTADLLVQAFKG